MILRSHNFSNQALVRYLSEAVVRLSAQIAMYYAYHEAKGGSFSSLSAGKFSDFHSLILKWKNLLNRINTFNRLFESSEMVP